MIGSDWVVVIYSDVLPLLSVVEMVAVVVVVEVYKVAVVVGIQ